MAIHDADDIRAWIRAHGYFIKIDRNEFVFHEGQPDDRLFLISSGRVVVQRRTQMGDIATVTLLGRDDLFGELAILGDSRRTATVRSLEKCSFHILNRDKFADLRAAHPEAGAAIEQMLADMVRRLTDQLVEALYEDARVRLARRLVSLAEMYEACDGAIPIPLTQEMIGSMAGVKLRQTAKRLQEFADVDLIRLERSRVFVTDYERLRVKGRLPKVA